MTKSFLEVWNATLRIWTDLIFSSIWIPESESVGGDVIADRIPMAT